MGYLSGQGKCYEAQRDINGNALFFRFLGNVPLFELALNITTVEHKESTSGYRLIDLRLITEKKVDLTMNVQEFTPENLALMAYGTLNTSSSGSVTNELLGGGSTAIVNGSILALKNANITSYKRFVLDLYNTQFDPATTLALIQDTVADNTIKGSVMVDPTRTATALGGQIGQMIFID
jgi:hypothetical protein